MFLALLFLLITMNNELNCFITLRPFNYSECHKCKKNNQFHKKYKIKAITRKVKLPEIETGIKLQILNEFYDNHIFIFARKVYSATLYDKSV